MTQVRRGDGERLALNNGVEMPSVGLGLYQSEPEDTIAAVQAAIASGYRLIDTAPVYFNEAQVGEGIRRSGVARDDLFVIAKLWISDYGHDATLHAFERSLRKLDIGHVDLYLLHWPVPSVFDQTIQSWKAAEKLLASGRVRAIGVSNFNADHLARLAEDSAVIPVVNQVELHPFLAQRSLREVHARLDIITQAWSPIGGINRYRTDGDLQDPLQHPVIIRIARLHGKTPAQIVLRWHIQNGVSVIPKSIRPERIAENIDIFDFVLSEDELALIDTLDRGKRGGPDPDELSPELVGLTLED